MRAAEPITARGASLGPADVLELQRSAGNKAVVQRLGGVRLLQRKPTGLREAAPTSTYTTAALAFWKDAANQSKPLADFSTHLIQKANEALKKLGYHEVLSASDSAQLEPGEFDPLTWTVTLNPALFTTRAGVSKVSDLTLDEAADVAGTVYHEARHSEQHFRIAQMVAGASKKQGSDLALEIKNATQIPLHVAAAAAKVPLAPSTANAQLLAEAKDWKAITRGLHNRYKNVVVPWEHEVRAALNVPFDPLRGVQARATLEAFVTSWRGAQRLKFVKDHIKTVQAIPRKSPVDRLVLTHLRAIEAAMATVERAWTGVKRGWDKAGPNELNKRLLDFDKPLAALEKVLHAAYVAQPHEKDAWEAGGAVGKEFRAGGKPAKP